MPAEFRSSASARFQHVYLKASEMMVANWQIHRFHAQAILSFFGNWPTARHAVLLAMFFAGCNPKVEGPNNEVFEQTYDIEPEAGLSIRNTDGSVVIHGTETTVLKLR